MKATLVSLVSLLAVASLACQDTASAVDPVWGKQACSSCSMLVSDWRYAAQLVTEDGARFYFDDPGCMATWLAEGRGRAQRTWVHSATGAWIDARNARYVGNQRSPMGFGFAPDEAGDARWADLEAVAATHARKETD